MVFGSLPSPDMIFCCWVAVACPWKQFPLPPVAFSPKLFVLPFSHASPCFAGLGIRCHIDISPHDNVRRLRQYSPSAAPQPASRIGHICPISRNCSVVLLSRFISALPSFPYIFCSTQRIASVPLHSYAAPWHCGYPEAKGEDPYKKIRSFHLIFS